MSYGAAPFASVPYGTLNGAAKGGSTVVKATLAITAGASTAFLSTFIPDGEIPEYRRAYVNAGASASFKVGKEKHTQFGVVAGATFSPHTISSGAEIEVRSSFGAGAGGSANFKAANRLGSPFSAVAGAFASFVSFADGTRGFGVVAGATTNLKAAARLGSRFAVEAPGDFAPSAASRVYRRFNGQGGAIAVFRGRDDEVKAQDTPDVLVVRMKERRTSYHVKANEIYVHA